VLARGEDHPRERHHAFLADRLANDREGLLADFAIRNDVVRAVQIELVDLLLGHELVDLDGALALDRDRFELFGLDLDLLAFADLIALDDVARINLVAGLGVHLAVFDAVAGLLVDLMEADFLSFAARGKQCNRTRDKRKFQEAFPICSRGHDLLHTHETLLQPIWKLACSESRVEDHSALKRRLGCSFVLSSDG
jgi:hypothetical protein